MRTEYGSDVGNEGMVVRVEGDAVVVRFGHDVTEWHLRHHEPAVQALLPYVGLMGRLRGLRDRVVGRLTGAPTQSHEGGLSAADRAKLTRMAAELDVMQTWLDTRTRQVAQAGERLGDVGLRERLGRERVSIEQQIAHHEGRLGSMERPAVREIASNPRALSEEERAEILADLGEERFAALLREGLDPEEVSVVHRREMAAIRDELTATLGPELSPLTQRWDMVQIASVYRALQGAEPDLLPTLRRRRNRGDDRSAVNPLIQLMRGLLDKRVTLEEVRQMRQTLGGALPNLLDNLPPAEIRDRVLPTRRSESGARQNPSNEQNSTRPGRTGQGSRPSGARAPGAERRVLTQMPGPNESRHDLDKTRRTHTASGSEAQADYDRGNEIHVFLESEDLEALERDARANAVPDMAAYENRPDDTHQRFFWNANRKIGERRQLWFEDLVLRSDLSVVEVASRRSPAMGIIRSVPEAEASGACCRAFPVPGA